MEQSPKFSPKNETSDESKQPGVKFDNMRVYWYDNKGDQNSSVKKSQVYDKIVPSEQFYDQLGYIAKILVCKEGIIKKYGLKEFWKKCRDEAKKDGYINKTPGLDSNLNSSIETITQFNDDKISLQGPYGKLSE